MLYGQMELTGPTAPVVERAAFQGAAALEDGTIQDEDEDAVTIYCEGIPGHILETDDHVYHSLPLETSVPSEQTKISEETCEPLRKRRRIHTRRQPLSEDDKRRNHKISEQRRRREMDRLLQQVRSLTPGIKQDFCSKSRLLESFADHMIKLKQENEILSRHLKYLEEKS